MENFGVNFSDQKVKDFQIQVPPRYTVISNVWLSYGEPFKFGTFVNQKNIGGFLLIQFGSNFENIQPSKFEWRLIVFSVGVLRKKFKYLKMQRSNESNPAGFNYKV